MSDICEAGEAIGVNIASLEEFKHMANLANLAEIQTLLS